MSRDFSRAKPMVHKSSHLAALSPEARENQMINLAVDLAEKQLRSGDASSQVITHFLKLGSTREELEKEKIRHENNLLEAKKKSLESSEQTGVMYEKAIKAFGMYSGKDSCDDDDGGEKNGSD